MRTIKANFIQIVATILFTGFSLHAQQMPEMPNDHSASDAQHEHMPMNGAAANFPQMGRAQKTPGATLFTLEDAQKLANEYNPTLREAVARINRAKARQLQAGLYPNPSVGYTADEIRGGSTAGGKQGFFLRQTIITGGKLANNRNVLSKEVTISELETEQQRLRVEIAIRTGFMRVLAAQELLDSRRELARIEQDYASAERLLGNSGQADETEILQAEISARRQKLATHVQENALLEQWRVLAAVIGKPDLPVAVVSGDLQTGWPELNEEQIVTKIASESPAARIALAAASRAEAEILQAKRAAVPDIELRGGLQYNNEPLGSVPPHAVGWEGLADVGVQIPIFNRNQGGVAAAQAESERANLEQQRVFLALRRRTTSVLERYTDARLMAVEYREELLPRARKAYSLMNEKYGQMLASYPRVIEMQRKLFELQCEYIQSLETVWNTGIALEGFLLTDGLENPARLDEIDPVRELDLPVPERVFSVEP